LEPYVIAGIFSDVDSNENRAFFFLNIPFGIQSETVRTESHVKKKCHLDDGDALTAEFELFPLKFPQNSCIRDNNLVLNSTT
jgi:hypothetical protein